MKLVLFGGGVTRRNFVLGAVIVLAAMIALFSSLSSTNVEGIAIDEELVNNQSLVENYRYRKLVSQALHGDAQALTTLVHVDCDGAGCYEHGEVLVHILIRIGEANFIRIVEPFNKEDKWKLNSLLGAGFDYKRLPKQQSIEWEKDYPKLAYILQKPWK